MRNGRMMPLLGLLLMGGMFLLAGCESDETAPNDPLPALSQDDVAGQAAIPAVAVTEIAPAMAGFDGGKGLKDMYTYTFGSGSDVQGMVRLDFRDGSATGDPLPWDEASWGRLWTEDGSPLVAEIEGFPLDFTLTADVVGDPYDPDAQTATISGSGVINIGGDDRDWSIEDVEASLADYPDGGTLTFTADDITVTVVYDGDETADVFVGDLFIGTVNLDTGTFEEYVED